VAKSNIAHRPLNISFVGFIDWLDRSAWAEHKSKIQRSKYDPQNAIVTRKAMSLP